MDISTKEKIQKFRKGSVNKFINLANVVLFITTAILGGLFILLMIFTIGFSMWAPRDIQIINPIEKYHLEETTNKDTIYINSLEDKTLYYTIKINANLKDELSLSKFLNRNNHEIIKLSIDDEEVELIDNYFTIEKGEYEIVIDLKVDVRIDEYKSYKAIKLYFDLEDEIILSEDFRQDDLEKRDKNIQYIYTNDSVGSYVNTYQRLGIYKALVVLYYLTAVFTTLNIIKIISFYFLTRGLNKENQVN